MPTGDILRTLLPVETTRIALASDIDPCMAFDTDKFHRKSISVAAALLGYILRNDSDILTFLTKHAVILDNATNFDLTAWLEWLTDFVYNTKEFSTGSGEGITIGMGCWRLQALTIEGGWVDFPTEDRDEAHTPVYLRPEIGRAHV